MASQHITRRASVAALVTTTAAAVPAASIIVADRSDAELIALGTRSEAMRSEILALRPECDRLCHLRKTEIFRRLGLPADTDVATVDRKLGARYVALLREVGEETGANQAIDEIESIYQRLDPIDRSILDMPALTLAGLAVKARAAFHAGRNCWDEPAADLSWNDCLLRGLVEDVCAVAGLSLANAEPDAEVADDAIARRRRGSF